MVVRPFAAKASGSTSVTEAGMVMADGSRAKMKQPYPMRVTDVGMVMLVMKALEKASSPRATTS